MDQFEELRSYLGPRLITCESDWLNCRSLFKQQIVLSRFYWLKVDRGNFDALQANISRRSKAFFDGLYASFKDIRFPRENIRPISFPICLSGHEKPGLVIV